MKKGQIFSLDFLLSLIIVFLAIGLLLRAVELTHYDQKEEQLYSELKSVAENAGNLLASNASINCSVDRINESIMNCVDTARINNNNAGENLGIPDGFGFCIAGISGITISCVNDKDFFEVKRKVLLRSGNLTKSQYNDLSNLAASDAREVTIRVWRE